MAKPDFVARNEEKFVAQLTAFTSNLGSYATVLGLTPEQVAAATADARYYAHLLDRQRGARLYARQLTGWRDFTRLGGAAEDTVAPARLSEPPAVPPVAPDIEGRFRALVRAIKAHPNYNEAIGRVLGIALAAPAALDLATLQPQLQVGISGDRVRVGWGWQGHSTELDQIEIQVDRGDGQGFVLLTFDTTPGYSDPTPLPTTATKWTYRAIYCLDDRRVGQWSQAASVVVLA